MVRARPEGRSGPSGNPLANLEEKGLPHEGKGHTLAYPWHDAFVWFLIYRKHLDERYARKEGIKEQQRLVSQTEIVQTATAEATRLIDSAHAEADRLRGECDIYVDSKLAEFEDFLNGTIRSVGRGRHQLRTAAGTHDYAAR